MRNYVFVPLLSLVLCSAHAQFNKGNLFVTGDLNYRNSSSKQEEKTGNVSTVTNGLQVNEFGFSTGSGYFVLDNLAVGLAIGFNTSKLKLDNIAPNTNWVGRFNIVNLTPFVRYYIPYSDKFAFFGNFGLGFDFGKSKNEYITGNERFSDETNITIFTPGLSCGFTYFVHKNIAIDIKYGLLGYRIESRRMDFLNPNDYSKISQSDFLLNFGLNTLNLGIVVFF